MRAPCTLDSGKELALGPPARSRKFLPSESSENCTTPLVNLEARATGAAVGPEDAKASEWWWVHLMDPCFNGVGLGIGWTFDI